MIYKTENISTWGPVLSWGATINWSGSMKPYKEVLWQVAWYLSLNAGPWKAVFALVVVEDLIETMASQTASAIVLILGTPYSSWLTMVPTHYMVFWNMWFTLWVYIWLHPCIFFFPLFYYSQGGRVGLLTSLLH